MSGARSYRALFCGGREWDDAAVIFSKMFDVYERHPDLLVVHGAGRGADLIAQAIAEWMAIPFEPHPADWDSFGRGAGPLRNQVMLNSGLDAVYAFKQGFDRTLESGGTEDMVRRATTAGVPTMVIEQYNPALPAPAVHMLTERTSAGISTKCGLSLQHPTTASAFSSDVTCEDCESS